MYSSKKERRVFAEGNIFAKRLSRKSNTMISKSPEKITLVESRPSPTKVTITPFNPVGSSPMRIPSPVRSSPMRIPSPVRSSPMRIPSPARVKTPEKKKSPSPVRVKTPEKKKSPMRIPSPARVKTPEKKKSPSPVRVKTPEKKKSPSPVRVKTPEKKKSPMRIPSPVRVKTPERKKSPAPFQISGDPNVIYKKKSPFKPKVKPPMELELITVPDTIVHSDRRISKRLSNRKTPMWSPRFSPMFRKVNAPYATSPEVSMLKERVSFEPLYNSIMFNALINNPNICIYPRDITVMVQGNTSYTNDLLLNEATTPEDYYEFADNHLFGYTRETFDNVHMRNFQNAWNADISVFEKECNKDIIIFPVELVGYSITTGHPVRKSFWHACQLIVDLKKNKAYYIDSQDNTKENLVGHDKNIYNHKVMYQYVCYKLEAWIYHIIGKRMKVEMLDLEAPQSITNDMYCIFWSFLLADTIIRYYGEVGTLDPKTVIKNILRKYNTTEKLNTLIRRYISYARKIEKELNLPLSEKITTPRKVPRKPNLWQKIQNFFAKNYD